MSDKKCPCCGATIDFNASECKYCGEVINVEQPQPNVQQPEQPQPYVQQMPQQPIQQQPYAQQPVQQPVYAQNGVPASSKNKTTAGILAILLGGLGVHKFYLGKVGLGILYLVFCWTYIPAIVGIIEGIIYLTSSEENFYNKYVRKK